MGERVLWPGEGRALPASRRMAGAKGEGKLAMVTGAGSAAEQAKAELASSWSA